MLACCARAVPEKLANPESVTAQRTTHAAATTNGNHIFLSSMTASILLRRLTRGAWRHFVVLVTIGSLPARADGFWDGPKAEPTDSIALTMPADAIVMLGSFAPWESSQEVRESIGPKTCNLCGCPDNFGLPTTPRNGRGTLNGVDAWFHDQMTGWLMMRKTSDSASGYLSYSAQQSSPPGHTRAPRRRACVGDRLREHRGHGPRREGETRRGSEATPYLWSGSGVLMLVTGTLRLLAETHYFTDVVGGTLLGAAVGGAMPLLHRAGSLM